MVESIDDVVKPKATPGSVEELLADDTPLHTEEWYDRPRSTLGKIWDGIKYAGMVGGMYAGLALSGLPALTMMASSYIASVGLTIGSWYDNKKKEIKNTWRRSYKEFSFGNWVGVMDYALFSIPELLLNAMPGFFGAGTLLSQVVKTLIFNPITVAPMLMVYNGMKYVRDYVGFNPIKLARKLPNLYKRAKFNVGEETKDIFKYLSPLHFLQLNYLPNPTARMVQSALINNPIFRYLTAKKENQYNRPEPRK